MMEGDSQMKSFSELHKRLMSFPEEKKSNPFYLMNYKNRDGTKLNPNSPSDLEWWLDDMPEKMQIIENHGFELLLMLESENITLKDAADKLIEWYQNQKV